MQELLKNAWLGWMDYTDTAKIVCLLFAALLFLWLLPHKKVPRELVIYGGVAAWLCVFPVSAAVLMLYQTRFYDYEWIWAVVPSTVIIAMGGTILFSHYRKGRNAGDLRILIVVSFLLFSTLLFSGNMGASLSGAKDVEKEMEKRLAQTKKVLCSLDNTEDVCLWAPKELMENVRIVDGTVRLFYGRNMWDPSLGAYSYDGYKKETVACYHFMEKQTGTKDDLVVGDEIHLSDGEAIRFAVKSGVNLILMPREMPQKELQYVEKILGEHPQEIEGYYLWKLWD